VPTSVKSVWNADTAFTERMCDFYDCSHKDMVAPEHCKQLSVSVSHVSIPLTSITSPELVCDPSSIKSQVLACFLSPHFYVEQYLLL